MKRAVLLSLLLLAGANSLIIAPVYAVSVGQTAKMIGKVILGSYFGYLSIYHLLWACDSGHPAPTYLRKQHFVKQGTGGKICFCDGRPTSRNESIVISLVSAGLCALTVKSLLQK